MEYKRNIKSLFIVFDIIAVVYSNKNIISSLTPYEEREILYSVEGAVFSRAAKSHSGTFVLSVDVDDKVLLVSVEFSKSNEFIGKNSINTERISKVIHFELQIENVRKEDNLITYNMDDRERGYIFNDLEIKSIISGETNTSGDIFLVSFIDGYEYKVKGKFSRRFDG